MNNKVRIIVYTNNYNFIKFLVNKKIKYNNLRLYKNNYILTCEYKSYKIISIFYKTNILRYYGFKNIINYIKINKYLLISIFFSILLFYNLINTIFDVKINTDNLEIKKMINDSLIKYDLVKYKKKKNYDEINEIKEYILDTYSNYIEWIEIENNGCDYIVNVLERINKENKAEKDYSNIVASKDGKILHINSYSGSKKVNINDYVKKGDVLISGEVTKDEEIIDYTNSSGTIFAETWYIVNITIPFNYTEYTETGRIINHYYIELFNKKFTIIGKYDSNNTINKTKLIIDKPYLFFKLYKEEKNEYEYKKYKISEKEAYNEAIKRSETKILNNLKEEEYIISKKVLKYERFSSKIKLEIFFKVYENIGVKQKIFIGEENGRNNK